MDISLILDRVLVFAAHATYSLAESLPLLYTALQSDTPSTHGHIVHRLVPKASLGALGRVDLLELLGPTTLTEDSVSRIALGAATSGHMPVLEWIRAAMSHHPLFDSNSHANDRHFSSMPLRHVFEAAVQHAHTAILDWCIAPAGGGMRFRAGINEPFTEATRYAQVASLEWLKAYAVQHGLTFEYRPVDRYNRVFVPLPAARQIAMLNWWRNEYTTRPQPMISKEKKSMTGIAFSTSDDPMQLVEWWRQYCAERHRPFRWPTLDAPMMPYLVQTASVDFCDWWWTDTVRQVGAWAAKVVIRDVPDILCELGTRADLLDWYWRLRKTPGNLVWFPYKWRPRRPLMHLSVIQWWESGFDRQHWTDTVFGTVGPDMDAHFYPSKYSSVSVAALDWWWDNRDRFGLVVRVSTPILAWVIDIGNYDILHWYFDHCTRNSELPQFTLTMVAIMVADGRMDMLVRLCDLYVEHGKPLAIYGEKIRVKVHQPKMATSAVLDGVWNLCARIGARFEPGDSTASAVAAMEDGDLDAAQWWYAMHVVHGTAFPSTADLSCVTCGGEMEQWIQQVLLGNLSLQ
ncbi:hypothetical protein BC828DRAFT_374544 [Blastocladiella britannica]|nr:hypothetical protein BC828DRAFT_374544 [Blastocladiella britannica]